MTATNNLTTFTDDFSGPLVHSGRLWKRLQDFLARRRRKFSKLKPAQKRVAIAKDVIGQLQVGKLRPRSTYFTPQQYINRLSDANPDVSECTAQTSCEVCGIGALFVSAVEFADKLKLTDFNSSSTTPDSSTQIGRRNAIVEYLTQWFERSQLDLIEVYFENGRQLPGNWFRTDPNPWSPITDGTDMRARMTMIMENIVSNRGKFNPLRGAHRVPSTAASQEPTS